MNTTLKVLKSIAQILVIFENEEEQDFLSYEYSTYEYTIHRTHRTYRRFENNCRNLIFVYFLFQNKIVIPKFNKEFFRDF